MVSNQQDFTRFGRTSVLNRVDLAWTANHQRKSNMLKRRNEGPEHQRALPGHIQCASNVSEMNS